MREGLKTKERYFHSNNLGCMLKYNFYSRMYCECTAQSNSRYDSIIVLRNVGIFSLLSDL